MILMSVSYYNAFYSIGIGGNIGEIRNNKVNSEHIFIGKSKTAVNDKHIAVIFKNGHIFADFVDAAEERDFDRLCRFGLFFLRLFLFIIKLLILFSSACRYCRFNG